MLKYVASHDRTFPSFSPSALKTVIPSRIRLRSGSMVWFPSLCLRKLVIRESGGLHRDSPGARASEREWSPSPTREELHEECHASRDQDQRAEGRLSANRLRSRSVARRAEGLRVSA